MDHSSSAPLPWSASDWSEASMGESLRLAAESLCAFGGFGAAALAVVRDDLLVQVAVAGAERLLDPDGRPLDAAETLGSSFPVSLVEDSLLPASEDWGLLRFVPHDRSNMPEFGWRLDSPYVGTGWHPHDMLVAPVRDAAGRLRGMLSMDAPIDGLRPSPESRVVLERYVAQVSRMLLTALEREELAERQRLAMAARRLLGRAADSDSPEAILADVSDELITAFQLAGLRAAVFEGADRRTLVETTVALGDLDPEVYRLSRVVTERLWAEQHVGLAGRDQVVNFDASTDDYQRVLGLLHQLDLESLLLVPLGAGEVCLGLIAFYRSAGAPRWTEAECEAAQEIGRDLGRLLSVQRALGLERAAVAELRALDDYKSHLIASVAHELKNPIAAIRGNLEITVDLVADVEEAAPTLRAMARGVGRIAHIVDDLLQLAAVNDPSQPAPRLPIDATRTVASAVQQAVESAGRARAKVRTDLPGGQLVVVADAHGLEQIVVNLVGNALKYTPADGTVAVSLCRQGDQVVITVADDGIGISPEDAERVFSEFFRSADPLARRQPGTGLGLAIVDRIVARHGGRVELESEVGRGSTFRVVLPVQQA
jgi:signal transduction histidine kinase